MISTLRFFGHQVFISTVGNFFTPFIENINIDQHHGNGKNESFPINHSPFPSNSLFSRSASLVDFGIAKITTVFFFFVFTLTYLSPSSPNFIILLLDFSVASATSSSSISI